MKKQNPPSTEAHVVRGTLYLLLLLSAFVIRLALGQQNAADSAIDPTKSSFAVGHATSGSAEAQPSPVAAATSVVSPTPESTSTPAQTPIKFPPPAP
ncbi:MAG: hypothetical protein WA496_12870 [Candidatus Udaeobacter sp.]